MQQDAFDLGHRIGEGVRHLCPGQVASSEDEEADASVSNGPNFRGPTSNIVVFRENHPISFASSTKPDVVGRPLPEVVVVDLHLVAGVTQRIGYRASPQRSVYKQNWARPLPF